MKTKEEIVNNWLPRYTGKSIDSFGKYFLLTNYLYYVELFAKWNNVKVEGKDKNMPSATAEGITIINFGMGSPNAATIMDLLSAVTPNAVLFLGKCGGLKKKNTLGILFFQLLQSEAMEHRTTIFQSEVPALPAFKLQSAISATITRFNKEYWTGTVYTTNRRVWEYDDRFKKYLVKTRAMAIDMETATIFTVGFANEIPTGALLLVSDQPMISTGIKTEASDLKVTNDYVEIHLKIGIDSLREIKNNGVSVKHLKF